jgi:hypothetical protein
MKANTMNINWKTGFLAAAFSVLHGCSDPEMPTPVPDTTPSGYTANFIFAHASPDAPSLDLYINNQKTGSTVSPSQVAQPSYTNVPITSSGAGGFTANTNIKARAASGSIGGVLGSDPVIYRAGNNNLVNFAAVNNAFYTVIAVDSIARPRPVRLLNASNFADTTYFYALEGRYISVVERAALTAEQKAKTFPIGIVPLGSTDPGGVRFYVVRDNFPTFSPGNTTQSAIRVFNAVPNSSAIWVRLVPTPGPGSNVTIGSNLPYIMAFPGFNPSVGSRTITGTTVNFTLQATASGSVAIDYTLEVSTNATFTNIIYTSPTTVKFDVNKVYTVVVRGKIGGTGAQALSVGIITHN